MENRDPEEILSRREFFKSAVKKALPILGTVAVVGLMIAKPTEVKARRSCGGECSNGCTSNDCLSSCMNGCKGTCSGCSGSCSGSCSGCSGGCTGCKGSCEYTSVAGSGK